MTTGLSAEDGENIEDPGLGRGALSIGAAAPVWGWARGLSTRRLRFPSWAGLWGGLRDEVAAQAERAFLWTPVAFGVGAAAYLSLKDEPPLWPCVVAAVLMIAAAVAVGRWGRHRALAIAASLAAVAVCGFCAGKLRTDIAAAPIVPAHFGVAPMEGWVVDVDTPSQHGERLLIAPTWIAGLAPEHTPRRVRIVVPPGEVLGPGSAIHVMALLDPPPGPAAPGAYDFARDAWFEGMGGVGMAMKPPQMINLEPPPWRLQLGMAVNSMRWSLAQTLASDLRNLMGEHDGGAVGLAVTVATSHEDWLDPQSRDDLRGSGLAHMLAIAGLHTAAVSGFVFFALRLAIAAWPWLALRVNGKKVAALGGLIAVLIYLTLSGAHPPARRAAVTASVAFLAILLDRRAISLHSLAIAALAVMVLEPEVVISPGFEMSFCATASLVAMAELWPQRHKAEGLPWYLAALQSGRDWILGMLAVSFVAGAATAPFSIQYFNRVANYGVFANLTADFLAGMVLMPALTLGVLLQALGVSHQAIAPLMAIAGAAARGIVAIGHLFSNLPGAKMTVSSAPTIALAISYLGIVFACLWRGRLRWIGVPLSFAVALWPRPEAPVAWIASDGGDAAVNVAGKAVALKPNERAYAVGTWAQRRGLDLPADPAKAQADIADCNRLHCTATGKAKPAIATWWTRRKVKDETFAALCKGADIVVTRAYVTPPADCKSALVLGPDDFAKGGAAEVFADRERKGGVGWRLVWSQPLRGQRPWSVMETGSPN